MDAMFAQTQGYNKIILEWIVYVDHVKVTPHLELNIVLNELIRYRERLRINTRIEES